VAIRPGYAPRERSAQPLVGRRRPPPPQDTAGFSVARLARLWMRPETVSAPPDLRGHDVQHQFGERVASDRVVELPPYERVQSPVTGDQPGEGFVTPAETSYAPSGMGPWWRRRRSAG
jgi:hypothetical protein